jgi:acyl-homoserine lactone acylase PvdQ
VISVTESQSISDEALNLAATYQETLNNAPGVAKYMQSPGLIRVAMPDVKWRAYRSGYPLIANDPHLTMDTPAIFHEAHLIYDKAMARTGK